MAKHLSLAHTLVGGVIRHGDSVIDATCGNGWDTLFLAKKVLTKTSGCVYGIDIQEVALKKTLNKLELEFSESELKRIKLFNQSHATFPEIIPQESISAIMYNLGYLPGGSKNIITRPSSTIMSLKSGRSLLKPGGIITILCYRGHDGGPDETDAVLKEISSLDSQYWEINTYDLLKSTSSPLLMTVVRKFAS